MPMTFPTLGPPQDGFPSTGWIFNLGSFHSLRAETTQEALIENSWFCIQLNTAAYI